MASRTNLCSASVAGLAFALMLSGCAQSSDPPSWAEAEEKGDKIRFNFLGACEEANTGDDGDVPSYCECSYTEVREFYADDFQGFKDAESELRSSPEAVDDPGVIPVAVVTALEGCAAEHLA